MAAKRAQTRRAPYNLLVCVYDTAVCHNAAFLMYISSAAGARLCACKCVRVQVRARTSVSVLI